MSYGQDRTVVPVLIANGTSLSAEIQTNAKRLIGIRMSAAWTAAAITFEALIDDPAGLPAAPVFGVVVDSAGAAITLATPTAATYMALPDTLALVALGRIKVRSGTFGAPVNQGADRNLELVFIDA